MTPDVLREFDSVRDATKAAHDEYDRLYNSVVFPNDSLKALAADWYKGKEYSWQMIQLEQFRTRRLGTGTTPWDVNVALNSADNYVEAEPSVFVQSTYYPKYVKTELTSLAKLATIRQNYVDARLRFAKALVVQEQKLAGQQ